MPCYLYGLRIDSHLLTQLLWHISKIQTHVVADLAAVAGSVAKNSVVHAVDSAVDAAASVEDVVVIVDLQKCTQRLAANVTTTVKFLSSQMGKNRSCVTHVSKVMTAATNDQLASSHAHDLSAKTHEIFRKRALVNVAEIDLTAVNAMETLHDAQHSMQYAATVAQSAKFHSNQMAASQYIVKIVTALTLQMATTNQLVENLSEVIANHHALVHLLQKVDVAAAMTRTTYSKR